VVCGVVPQPESCGTDSGTGEIPVFSRFSILLYQCTKVPSKYKGGLASPLTPSSQLHNLQPIPPFPLWYGGTWYRTRPPAPHSSHAPSSADTPFSPLVRRYAVQDSCPHRPGGSSTQLPARSPLHVLVQRYMVRRSGMSKIAGQPSTVRARQGTAPCSPAPRPPAQLNLPK